MDKSMPKGSKSEHIFDEIPELKNFWDYQKNKIQPEELTPISNRRVHLKCSKGGDHEWSAQLNNFQAAGRCCPYCINRRISNSPPNHLLGLHPALCGEWDYEKNGNLRPNAVVSGTAKKVWWLCSDEGHSFEAAIRERVKDAEPHSDLSAYSSCPYCSNRKLLSSFNSLPVREPELAKEWHPNMNKDLTPYDILFGTNKKKIWWQCKFGHEWEASPNARLSNNSGCAICAKQGTSLNELRLYSELSHVFPDIRNRHKLLGKELDCFIPDLNIGIEYDGSYWHRNKHDADLEKNNFFTSRGITVLRVREKPLEKLNDTDLLISPHRFDKKSIDEIFRILEQVSPAETKKRIDEYIQAKSFLQEKKYNKFVEALPAPPDGKTLESRIPFINEFWDYEKNHPLLPIHFTEKSNQSVYLKCPRSEDHRWKRGIQNINEVKESMCPFCSGRRASSEYNALALIDDLESHLHPTKNNEIDFKSLMPSSNIKLAFRCSKCKSHEYVAALNGKIVRYKSGSEDRYKFRTHRFCSVCSKIRITKQNAIKEKMQALRDERNSVTVRGIKYSSIKEACSAHGIKYATVLDRLERGLNLESAVTDPLGLPNKPISVNGKKFETIGEFLEFFQIGRDKYNAVKDAYSADEIVKKFSHTKSYERPHLSVRVKGKDFKTLRAASAFFSLNYNVVQNIRQRKGSSVEEAILEALENKKG
jgi:hypothetical protein